MSGVHFSEESLRELIDPSELSKTIKPGTIKGKTFESFILDHLQTTLSIIVESSIPPEYIIEFARLGFRDSQLPFGTKKLSRILEEGFRDDFINKQDEMLSVEFDMGEHKSLTSIESVPFRTVRNSPTKSGYYGKVQKVYMINDKNTFYARKTIDINERTEGIIRRELDIYKKIPKHPHLLYLRASYDKDGSCMFIMYPWADTDLQQFIERNNSYNFWKNATKDNKRSTLINWSICIASGLHFLHSSNIKHRDLKPDNILLKEDNRYTYPIICDYGLSKSFQETSRSLKKEGNTYYESPEQKRGKKSGRSADIFSLGAIFVEIYYILGGVKRSKLKKLVSKEGYAGSLSNIEKILDNLPNDKDMWRTINNLIKNMLSENPTTRYSAHDITNYLIDTTKQSEIPIFCDHSSEYNRKSSSPTLSTADDTEDTESDEEIERLF